MDLQVPLFAVDSYIGLLDIHASETFVMVLDSLKEVCLACVARLRTAVACRVLNSLADVAPVPRSLRHSFIPGAHVLLSGCGQEQRAEGTVRAPVSSLQHCTAHARTHRRPILQQLKGRHLHHSFPFNHCFRDMHMDAALVGRLRSWTLQFVYLRPVVSVLSVGLQVRCSVWWPGSQWQVHTLTTRHM